MRLITALWIALRVGVSSRAALIAENLALRHQLMVLQRSVKRHQLRPLDRLLGIGNLNGIFTSPPSLHTFASSHPALAARAVPQRLAAAGRSGSQQGVVR